jgi:RimJ/RimL family protein N-acetyltransferase
MQIALHAPIESERLLMRIVERADLPDLLEINSSDEVTRYLPYSTWHTLADGEAWYERVVTRHSEGAAMQLVVVERRSRRVIGTSLLFNFDQASERAELGYVLGKAHWRQGLMHEALTALLQFAFDEMGLRRIEAHADARNVASDGLLRKLGFTHEGLLRQRALLKGETTDSNVYGLLRSEWRDSLRHPPTPVK